MILDRRKFLRTAAATGAAAAFGSVAAFDLVADTTIPGSFDFVFFTDTHIEPELEARHTAAPYAIRKSRRSNRSSPSWAATTSMTQHP